MYCEIPIFKRCCFCLPLRWGLIGYGYLRLVIILIFVMFLAIHPIGWNIVLIVLLIETIMTLVFIIGCHKKNPQLLKVYMWYITVTTGMLILFQVIAFFTSPGKYNEHMLVSLALDMVLQMYLVFLIRSEVLKLEARSGMVHVVIPEESVDVKPAIVQLTNEI